MRPCRPPRVAGPGSICGPEPSLHTASRGERLNSPATLGDGCLLPTCRMTSAGIRGMLRSIFRPISPFAPALGAALLAAAGAAAQAGRSGAEDVRSFAIAEWNTENGLPSNAVRDIR